MSVRVQRLLDDIRSLDDIRTRGIVASSTHFVA